jgi:hypothetical protein
LRWEFDSPRTHHTTRTPGRSARRWPAKPDSTVQFRGRPPRARHCQREAAWVASRKWGFESLRVHHVTGPRSQWGDTWFAPRHWQVRSLSAPPSSHPPRDRGPEPPKLGAGGSTPPGCTTSPWQSGSLPRSSKPMCGGSNPSGDTTTRCLFVQLAGHTALDRGIGVRVPEGQPSLNSTSWRSGQRGCFLNSGSQVRILPG